MRTNTITTTLHMLRNGERTTYKKYHLTGYRKVVFNVIKYGMVCGFYAGILFLLIKAFI